MRWVVALGVDQGSTLGEGVRDLLFEGVFGDWSSRRGWAQVLSRYIYQ